MRCCSRPRFGGAFLDPADRPVRRRTRKRQFGDHPAFLTSLLRPLLRAPATHHVLIQRAAKHRFRVMRCKGRLTPRSFSAVPVASDAARGQRGFSRPHEGRDERGREMKQKANDSAVTLLRLPRQELVVLLRKIACELPTLNEGSAELRNAHPNLQNIRRALTRAGPPAELRQTFPLRLREELRDDQACAGSCGQGPQT
jgi:hypothetical protein